MLSKTHIVITLFFVWFFFSTATNFFFFLFISLFATILPDIDTRFSKIGKYKIFRILNFFTKHRGFIHSFSFMLILSVFILLFFKEILLPFVLGYSLHLLIDSLTILGIRPFYPIKFKIRGKLKTNGIIENILFILFALGDLFLIFDKFFNVI